MRRVILRLVVGLWTMISLVLSALAASGEEIRIPRSLDPRIQIELVAAEPTIVTPTGLAVDERGRVYVIESHTHFRPENYDGPPTDRILLFEKEPGNGRVTLKGIFFEGTTATMNIRAYHDGSFFVATRNEIMRLKDHDADGTADKKATIARLETSATYPHNGLTGFAFDFAGNVYYSMGENFGEPYELIGSDGATIKGAGGGGGVFRCLPDGSGLVQIANGFWNPFHMEMDSFERHFCVDNDPDWRPPCRLLHVVAGGDYGFRFRHGRRGIHPFTSWFGTVPGTLGLVAGTGEAPSGILCYESDHLPDDYRGAFLTTSWGYHAIERFRLERNGASFKAVPETVIKGDEQFRPVGIALAPDGSLYVSDWVDASYDLHKKGRLWRISSPRVEGPANHEPASDTTIRSAHRPWREWAARGLLESDEGLATLRQVLREDPLPEIRALALRALATRGQEEQVSMLAALRDASPDVRELAVKLAPAIPRELLRAAAEDSSLAVRAEALRRMDPAVPEERRLLLANLGEDDAFLRHAAREVLRRGLSGDALASLALEGTPIRRVEIALLWRSSGDDHAGEKIPILLADEHPQVRFVGIRWSAEARLLALAPTLRRGLSDGFLSGSLFEATLAALQLLSSPEAQAGDFETRREEILALVLDDERPSPAVLVNALRYLPANHKSLGVRRLRGLLQNADPWVRVEAARSLRTLSDATAREALLKTVLAQRDVVPWEEALAGLAPEMPAVRQFLFSMLRDLRADDTANDARLRHDVLRSLAGVRLTEEERRLMIGLAERDEETKQLVARLLGEPLRPQGRPPKESLDAWVAWAAGGDPMAGERLFYHPQGPKCSLCHRVRGRGGVTGPDLTTIGQSPPGRILESILFPNRNVAPYYVTWQIVRRDGSSFVGVMAGEEGAGHQIYLDAEGREIKVHRDEIEVRQALSTSIMPEGLADTLTDGELRDLVAFLASCH